MAFYWYSTKNVSNADKNNAVTSETGNQSLPDGERGAAGDFHFDNTIIGGGGDLFDMLCYDSDYIFDGSQDYAERLTFNGYNSGYYQNLVNPIYGKVNYALLSNLQASEKVKPFYVLNVQRMQSWYADVFAGRLMKNAAVWSQTGKDKLFDDLASIRSTFLGGDIGQCLRAVQATPAGAGNNDDPLTQDMLDDFEAYLANYKQKFPDGT